MVDRIRRARVENWSDRQLCDEAVGLASEILAAAASEGGWMDRWRTGNRIAGGMVGREFMLQLADAVLRPRRSTRAAAQLVDLVHDDGVPADLPWHQRGGLLLAGELAPVLPDVVMPLVRRWVWRGAGGAPGHRDLEAGIQWDLGHVARPVMGAEAAERRLASCLRCLEETGGAAVTLSLGSLCHGVHVLAYEEALEQVKAALRRLFRSAGTMGKRVTIEPVGIADLAVTMDAFCEVLEEGEFMRMEAGVALWSCFPESFRMQKELTDWAGQRVADDGAPVRLRVAKGRPRGGDGADASRHGWDDAEFGRWQEVDANFQRMVRYACHPRHAEVVRAGVGCTHLCDLAWGLLLRASAGVEDRVELEVGDGVPRHLARVVDRLAPGLVMRVPLWESDSVEEIVACLKDRAEAAAAPELPGDGGIFAERERWRLLRNRLQEASSLRDSLPVRSRREQNREIEYAVLDLGAGFGNAPDTDWTREVNRDWIGRAMAAEWSAEVCDIRGGGDAVGVDPGDAGRETCRYAVAGVNEVAEALSQADSAWRVWDEEVSGRRRMLKEVACGLSRGRDRLIAVLVSDTGKSVQEADWEVSAAIDLANYYADGLWWPGLGDGVSAGPLGVVVVVPACDAPLMGACGGVLAALMGGNAVVLNPAPGAVLAAWRMVEVLWESGVPERLLQFLPVADGEARQRVVTDPRVRMVVLHGRSEVVETYVDWRPEMRLVAASPGKTSVLVTAAADRDRAVRDLIDGAFAQAGQKETAVSIAILEAEVYDDPDFLDRLRDAAASVRTGTGWDLASMVTPLVDPPDVALERALTGLDAGESWLLRPEHRGGPLWSPGIRMGVRPDSWFARAHWSGPVLGLIRVPDFEAGLRLQNAGGFGRAAGLQSLDEREARLWKERVRAGQATVNGSPGGMDVGRHPAGGWLPASPMPAAHAGGPNVVLQFVRWQEEALPTIWGECPGWLADMARAIGRVVPEGAMRLTAAAGSYAHWWAEEFGRGHDPRPVVGESNVFRYRPLGRVICRVDGMAPVDVGLVCMAARRCGVVLECSGTDGAWGPVARAAGVTATEESESAMIRRLDVRVDAIRLVAARPALRRAAFEAGIGVADGAVLANGRLELLHFLREQAVRTVSHRGRPRS